MKPIVWESSISDSIMPKIKAKEQKWGTWGADDLPHLWDAYAEAGYKHVVKLRLFKEYWEVMEGLLVLQPGAIVLDGGCGIGAMFFLILKKIWPKEIVAVDWSRKMLYEAKKTANKIVNASLDIFVFDRVDLSKPYPWPDDSFDAQIYSITLYYLPYRSWEQALEESYRTIKPGGYIYASIMFEGWDFPAMIKKNIPREFLANPYRCIKAAGVKNTARKFHTYVEHGIIEYPTREEFLNFLINLGFKIEIEKEIFQGGGMVIRARKIQG